MQQKTIDSCLLLVFHFDFYVPHVFVYSDYFYLQFPLISIKKKKKNPYISSLVHMTSSVSRITFIRYAQRQLYSL